MTKTEAHSILQAAYVASCAITAARGALRYEGSHLARVTREQRARNVVKGWGLSRRQVKRRACGLVAAYQY